MASQILQGEGNVTYTNTTGGSVRIVINYLQTDESCIMSWTGSNGTVSKSVIGKYGKQLTQYYRGYPVYMQSDGRSQKIGNQQADPLPLEIALGNNHTFSITSAGSGTNPDEYNIIIIPESG